MLGAIIGDIAGSRFEWENHKSKEFVLMVRPCRTTDDSNMTLAVAKAILESGSASPDAVSGATLTFSAGSVQEAVTEILDKANGK